MIDDMKVSVALLLTGDASKKMELFQKSIGVATKKLEALNAGLNVLEKKLQYINPLLNTFARKAAEAASAMGDLGANAKGSASAFNSFGDRVSSSSAKMNGAARAASNLKTQLIALNSASAGSGGKYGRYEGHSGESFWRAGGYAAGAGGAAGGGGRRGGGGKGSHFDHFGREMGGGKLTAMGAMLSTGNVGLAAAFGGVLAVKDSYQAQSRFQEAQAQLAGQGFGASANAAATKTALGMNLRGVSSTEALQAINDAATTTRNIPSALALAPLVAKMEMANSIIYQQQGKKFTRADEQRMLQFAELRTGSTDPVVLAKTLNQIEQAYSTDAARLSTNDLRTGGRQGQLFIQNLSDRAFAEMLPLYQSTGGQRTSTGLASLQTSLYKGQNLRTGKKAVAEFERLGVYKNGKLDPKYLDQVTHNPIEFIHDTLAPLMEKKGITTPGQQAQEFSVLFTQTSARIAQAVMEMWPRIYAQGQMLPQAADVQSNYVKALSINPGHIKAFETSLDSMMTNLGKFSSPAVNKGIDILINFFDSVSALTTDPSGYLKKETSIDSIAARVNKTGVMLNSAGQGAIKAGIGLFNWIKPSSDSINEAIDKYNKDHPIVIHTHVNIDSTKVAHAISPAINRMNTNDMHSAINGYNSNMASSPPMPGNTN